MAIGGDARMFVGFFPDDLIPEILNLVLAAWRKFDKPKSDEKEEPITRRFRLALVGEKNRHALPFSIWHESPELPDEKTGEETGRVDIRFLHGYREDVYFAFECKRLNIDYPSGFQSNAGEYVGDDGMMCFITGKYGKGLKSGGMIGYVMDGKVPKAIQAVQQAILKKGKTLRLRGRTGVGPCSPLPGVKSAKETHHSLPNRDFEIYHLFLAV